MLNRLLLWLQQFVTQVIPAALWSAGYYRLPGLAAEMAYNWMLGLFPLILMGLTAIGLFSLSPQNTYEALIDQLDQVAPVQALSLVDRYVREISYGQNFSLFSVSFLATLWGGSGALSAAMIALDMSHQVKPDYLRSFWHRRALSIVLTIGMLALTSLASLLLFFSDQILDQMTQRADQIGFNPLTEGLAWIGIWLDYPIAIAMLILACASLYRFGPSTRYPQIPLVPGALCASVLWIGASTGLQLYVTNFTQYNQVYGTLGAFIVLLLWLWLSSLALLLGEQINIALFRFGLIGPRSLPPSSQR